MEAMKRRGWCAAALLFAAGGCATSDETLAERDRRIEELRKENEAKEAQLRDARAAQELTQTQLVNEQCKARDLEAAKKAPPPAEPKPIGEKPVAEESPKPRRVERDATVKDKDVTVENRADGSLSFRLGGSPFNVGSAKLSPRGREALTKIGAELRKSKGAIVVEGHTDSTPLTGKNKETWGDNMNLSIARAVEVKNYLVEHCRIGAERITVSGKGDTRPLVKGSTKEAHAKNRRVEIVVEE